MMVDLSNDFKYTWSKDKLRCKVVTKAPFKKGIKRNALIELENGRRIVVPWRSIRRIKTMDEERVEYYNEAGAKFLSCPECGEMTYLAGSMPLCTSCGWSPHPEY